MLIFIFFFYLPWVVDGGKSSPECAYATVAVQRPRRQLLARLQGQLGHRTAGHVLATGPPASAVRAPGNSGQAARAATSESNASKSAFPT